MNQQTDINVVNQVVKFTYSHNGVTVEYSMKPTDDSSPFAVIDLIDRLTFAISEIGATSVSVNPATSVPTNDKPTYKAKCDDCNDIAVVTFRPRANKPFYCEKCYNRRQHKGETRLLS